jgi:hypothetical protein
VVVEERSGEKGLFCMYGRKRRRGATGGAVGSAVEFSVVEIWKSAEPLAGLAIKNTPAIAAIGRKRLLEQVRNICAITSLPLQSISLALKRHKPFRFV